MQHSNSSQTAEALMNRGLINLEQKDIASGLIDLEKAFLLKPHIKGIWITYWIKYQDRKLLKCNAPNHQND